jgi:hypothetical protein
LRVADQSPIDRWFESSRSDDRPPCPDIPAAQRQNSRAAPSKFPQKFPQIPAERSKKASSRRISRSNGKLERRRTAPDPTARTGSDDAVPLSHHTQSRHTATFREPKVLFEIAIKIPIREISTIS